MMTWLIIVVLMSVVVSAICSFTEAVLFSVPIAHVKYLADSGSHAGKILLGFKEELSRPVAAILVLNTIANTVGASIAGALVAVVFTNNPDVALVVFSIFFTLLILCFGEIIPKQIGAIYGRSMSVLIAHPLNFAMKALSPIIAITQIVTRLVKRSAGEPGLIAQDFLSMANIGTEEGVLDHLQGSVICNVIGLDRRLVRDILTPRVVVFRLPHDTTISEIENDILEWSFTRVPLYDPEDPEQVTSYVIQRDIYRAILRKENNKPLSALARPLPTVPELMRVDKLMLQMFERGETACSVVDEHAGFAGLVTLEDVIEEIVGREIVDEYDLVSDLRSYAQILFTKKKRDRE